MGAKKLENTESPSEKRVLLLVAPVKPKWMDFFDPPFYVFMAASMVLFVSAGLPVLAYYAFMKF